AVRNGVFTGPRGCCLPRPATPYQIARRPPAFSPKETRRRSDMSQQIPVLDLAPLRDGVQGAAERLGGELREAFTEVGFYFVRNHGIPQSLLDATFEAAERFHAQPIEAKLAVKINEHNIGYMPMRGATTRV